MQGILETVDRENVGFIFDVGHANTNGNVESFLKLKDKMIHTHVHDNHGERDEHLPVGNGTVPWKKVAAAFEGLQRPHSYRIPLSGRGAEVCESPQEDDESVMNDP